MADIGIANCTITVQCPLSGATLWKVVTPATADDGDTFDFSTYAEEIFSASCYGATDGNLFLPHNSSLVCTLPGSTDNEARTCYILGRALKSTGGST